MVIKTKDNRTKTKKLVYADNVYLGFIFFNAGKWNYAFGKSSAPSFIAFEVDSMELAINRLVENQKDFLSMLDKNNKKL